MYYWLTQYNARGISLGDIHFNTLTHCWETGLEGNAEQDSGVPGPSCLPADADSQAQASHTAPSRPRQSGVQPASPVSTQPALTEHFPCAGPCGWVSYHPSAEGKRGSQRQEDPFGRERDGKARGPLFQLCLGQLHARSEPLILQEVGGCPPLRLIAGS